MIDENLRFLLISSTLDALQYARGDKTDARAIESDTFDRSGARAGRVKLGGVRHV